jgi:hypothetical protein
MTFTNFLSLVNGLTAAIWRPQVRIYSLLALTLAGFGLALIGFLLQPEPANRHLIGDGISQHLVSRMYDLVKDSLYAGHHINFSNFSFDR